MSNRSKLSVNAYEANSQFFRIIWMKDTVALKKAYCYTNLIYNSIKLIVAKLFLNKV